MTQLIVTPTKYAIQVKDDHIVMWQGKLLSIISSKNLHQVMYMYASLIFFFLYFDYKIKFETKNMCTMKRSK